MKKYKWVFGDGLLERMDGLVLRSRFPNRGYDVLRCSFPSGNLSAFVDKLDSAYPWVIADLVDANFRYRKADNGKPLVPKHIRLPFKCHVPQGLPTYAEMAEDGMSITVEVPEGTVVTLTQTYGLPSSCDRPDPYVALAITLPNGASATVYWDGDGSFDGWDWGSNLPSDLPEKKP